MKPRRIRPLALGLFLHQGRILVFEGHDEVKNETYYRPPGGGIEFGEHSRDALVREIREELEAEITGTRYVATFENIFTVDGRPGHEIILMYAAEFLDASVYGRDRFLAQEDDGTSIQMVWQPVSFFLAGCAPLYPEGLVDWLRESGLAA